MASIHDRIEVAHLVVVLYDEDSNVEAGWDRSAERYRAECSCGWSGDWHHEGPLAEADADDHREILIGPADGLDGLMSELLDLQDDLARAVMWLAEHWSADLPVPGARAFGADRARIELSAYCGTAGELTRAADVLGALLVDDPAPDSRGNRYRRATRPFGRVQLRVFRELTATCEECGAEMTGEACPTCGQRADARPVTTGAA
jgi:hypothetical protein